MFKTQLFLICICLAAFSTGVSAKVVTDDPEIEKKLGKITRIVTDTINRHNFSQTPLDDDLSKTILKTYINDLDPNRSYFLADDIKQYRQYENKLDDALTDSNLEPAYIIFNRYHEQVNRQLDYALNLLDKEFDFTIDEEYQFDREDESWAKSQQLLNDVWRKRVKNDFLGLKLSSNQDEDEIRETLRKNFQNLRRRTNQLNSNDVFQLFINAYTASVEPHTNYFSPRTSKNFKIRMSLSLEGIGAVLEPENEYTKVRRVVPGGPAATSKLLNSGDRITGVGQNEDGSIVNVVGWRLDDVVDLIRGPKGTTVKLQVLPKSAPEGISKIIALVRDKIKLEEQAAKKELIEIDHNKQKYHIGVITLPTFYSDFEARQRGDKNYRSTTRDVKQLLVELKNDNVDGIILDLRDNGGGSLTEANELTGLFIKSGPIVQIMQSDGKINLNHDPNPNLFYDGPLAVLVNRNSASASEILTGAIQDYRRGIIIGEPTFGKGTVQNLIDLNQFQWIKDEKMGQLKMTIAQFFRVNGDSTQHRGVVPDIVYPTAFDIENHGERSIVNAIPWAHIVPTRFIPYEAGFTDEIKRKIITSHNQRIKNDPGFHYLLTKSRSDYEIEKQKVVSLMETKRREQSEKLNNQRLARYNLYRLRSGREEVDKETWKASRDQSSGINLGVEEDVLLNEAANILSDFLSFNQTSLAGDITPIASELN